MSAPGTGPSEQGVCSARIALPFAPWRDERGVSAAEYSLMGVLIGLAIIVGVTFFGEQLNDAYENIAKRFNDAVTE